MKQAWVSAGLAAATLAGCVHYAPAPAQPERFAAALNARRLDDKPAGAIWSGGDLLAAALARNPQVAASKAAYVTALEATRTAKRAPGLTLTLTAEYADEAPPWGYGGAFDAPIDAGGRRRTRITTVDLQALQAWYAFGETVWSVRTALAKARAEVACAADEVAKAEAAVALRRDRLARLERRITAGEDDRFLALAAHSELAGAERRLADARGRREQGLVALAKTLGVGPSAVQALSLAALEEAPAPENLPAWRRDAALVRSDVLRAIADYDIAETSLRLEVAKQYPEVRISPGYTYDHGVSKLPFSLSLALPTYDLNRRAIDEAEAGRAAAARTLEAVQAEALWGVDAAAAALVTAQANVDRAASRELPAAEGGLVSTMRSVQVGEADRTDELAAQAAEIDAELSLLDARRTALIAAADLEDALRRPFDPAEAAVLQAALTRPGEAR